MTLQADKQRLEKLKEQLLKSIEDSTTELRSKDAKVRELQHKRT